MEFFPRIRDDEGSEDGEQSLPTEDALPLQPLQILLKLEDNLFVRIPVPKRGVVCSNQSRVERICSILDKRVCFEVPWGPKIYIGEYMSTPFFIASAPVGSGSGLMFTELYAAGAEYIVRYGSDDVKSPSQYEHEIIKIIDEADNLYGFNIASGVPEEEWGTSVAASPLLVKCLTEESKSRNLQVETRICHHLENYHSLRTPHKFGGTRETILRGHLSQLEAKKVERASLLVGDNHAKKSSFDMETAVLFRVAKDFTGYVDDDARMAGTEAPRRRHVLKHAASVLQTVNKESAQLGPYEGNNKTSAVNLEKTFIEFVLSALLRLPV
jgi:hypothetical protein